LFRFPPHQAAKLSDESSNNRGAAAAGSAVQRSITVSEAPERARQSRVG